MSKSTRSARRAAPLPSADPLRLDLAVTTRSLASLRPSERNARTYSDHQIHQIAGSIAEFGFTNPLLTDEAGEIIAGHGRLAAAKLLGLVEVPVIVLGHLSAAQKRALRLADNKLALNAGWDADRLRIELVELSGMDFSFDLDVTGFATAEIDLVIDGTAKPPKADPADAVPEPDGPAVSRAGDLWLLGPHKLICGDALKAETFASLMGEERARLVFSDPPYNVPIDGHVGGLGATKHREFAMASGEMSREAFTAFLQTVFANLCAVSLDGAIHYQCMDWRHMPEMMTAGEGTYAKLLNLCVWAKDNGGMGSFYRSRHELVFVWKHGDGPHLNAIELGRHGRYRTNVWDYAGVNTLRRGRAEELAMHPTVKPVAMVVDAIKDASRRNDIVLDAFGGSGTTLIAAEKAKRQARLVEIDPIYCDTIVRRWEAFTGKAAKLEATGASFSETEAARKAEAATKKAALAETNGETMKQEAA